MLNFIGTSTGNNSRSGSTIPIIAGAVGGAAVFFIIILCFVILYIRRSHKKRSHDDDKKMPELNSDINMNANPSYDITELSRQRRKSYEDQYDYVINEKYNGYKQETMRTEHNPSYGRVQGCNNDVYDTTTVQHPNAPSGINSKSSTRIPEEEHYVDTNHYPTTTTDIATKNNPYDLAYDGIELEDNPCYIYS